MAKKNRVGPILRLTDFLSACGGAPRASEKGASAARGALSRRDRRTHHHRRRRPIRSRRGASSTRAKYVALLSRMTPPLLANPELTPIEQLGEAIADIAAGIHAATYQLLVLLQQFDARNGWNGGFLSCAHWLSWRTSIDVGAAREKVRVARAGRDLVRQGPRTHSHRHPRERRAPPGNRLLWHGGAGRAPRPCVAVVRPSRRRA